MLVILLALVVESAIWRQFGNEIVNDIMSTHDEVLPTCWSVLETEKTVEIAFHARCSFPELIFAPSLRSDTTVRVTFEEGAGLKHLSLCDVFSSSEYYVDGHNAPENMVVEFAYGVRLPFTRNHLGQVRCGSERQRRTEVVAHSRNFHFDSGHCRRDNLKLRLPPDYLAGSLLITIASKDKTVFDIEVEGFDPTTPSVLFQTDSSEFTYNAIYQDGEERTDLFFMMFPATERDIIPNATANNAIRFMQTPDKTEECVLLQSSPHVWSNAECVSKTSSMTLQPRGTITVPSSMASWMAITIQYPMVVWVGDGLLKARELDLTRDISAGVAWVHSSPVVETVIIDRNQPHFIVEDLQFAKLSIPKNNSIDTSKVLFYGSYKKNKSPKGLVVKCKTRFYHSSFSGDDDCSCIYDGGFNHLDCDCFTRYSYSYLEYGIDLTIRSDIHRNEYRHFHTLTVDRDVEIAIGFAADTLDLTDRSVVFKSAIRPGTLIVSSRTRITLTGGSHTLRDVELKNPLDSLPEPLFTVDGHATVYFGDGNVLASECMLLARVRKGSSLFVDSPINVVILKDRFYIHSPDSLQCSSRDELKDCFRNPALCDSFFYHPEQKLMYNDYTFEWDWNDRIIFALFASNDITIEGNNISVREIEFHGSATSVVVKGNVRLERIAGARVRIETERCSSQWTSASVDTLSLLGNCTERIIPKGGLIEFSGRSVRLGLGWSRFQSITLKHGIEVPLVSFHETDHASYIETDVEIVDAVGDDNKMLLIGNGMTVTEGVVVVGCDGICTGCF